MASAIEAVKGGMSVLRASTLYDVPRTTLQDRVKGRVKHGNKPGPTTYLTTAEEEELASFLMEVSKVGYGKTRKEVKLLVEAVAREKGVLRGEKISDGWFRRFLERRPRLSLRRGDATANVRMEALDIETKNEYFKSLEETLKEQGLMNSPGQIYNVDETGVPLDHKPPNVVARKGQKKVRYRISGNKKQITVVGCVNAAGQAIPPFVIFDAKCLNHDWTDGEVPRTTYGLSSNGWIDSELFHGWLTNHFLKHAVGSRPLLLLLDGHSSHYNPATIRFAKDHDVVVICLPPHTTHDSQPLDTCVFGPLKRNWGDVCHKFMQQHPGQIVTKYQFSALFNDAWMRTMVPTNIVAGFKKCGVYPFNPSAIVVETPLGRIATTGETTSVVAGNIDGGMELDEDHQEEGEFEFTPEEESKFETRYEEGYDLYDPRYSAWLKHHHPESAPTSHAFDSGEVTSVLDAFAHVPPCHANELVSLTSSVMPSVVPGSSLTSSVTPSVVPGSSLTSSVTPSVVPGSSLTSSVTPSVVPGSSLTSSVTPSVVPGSSLTSSVTPSVVPGSSLTSSVTLSVVPGSNSSVTPSVVTGSSLASSSVTPSVVPGSNSSVTPSPGSSLSSSVTPSPGSSLASSSVTPSRVPESSRSSSSSTSPDLTVISKYLVQYVPTPKRSGKASQRVSGFRVLTSSKSLSVLEEKAEKKKAEAKQKEKRKKEMEEKRKQKEILKKKKEEEKAAKADERRKRQEAIATKRSKQPTARKGLSKKARLDASTSTGECSTSGTATVKPTSIRSGAKGKQKASRSTEEIDTNQCQICFRTYEDDIVEETGEDWIECACGRWVHESCVDYDIVVDASGREKICPHCAL